MQPTSSMASKYRYLFKVPGSKHAIILLILTSVLIGLFQSVATLHDFYSSVIVNVLALSFIPILVNVLLKNTILKNFRVSSLRRINHLSLFENYFILAASLIGFLISHIEKNSSIYSVVFCSVLSLIIYIRVTILCTFIPSAFFRGFIAGILEPLARGIMLASMLPNIFNIEMIATSISIGIIFSTISLIILARPIKENVSPLRLAGGFVSSLLVGDGNYLESMLERLSSEYSGVSDVFLFKRIDGKKVAVIIPPFHFGPFRTIGSSMLSFYIDTELQKYGIEAVVLKGCTGHEANLVSNEESKKISKEIAEKIHNNDADFTDVICFYPARRQGRVNILGFNFSGKIVLIPTLHPEPMEDLPQIISHIASHYNALVIDPHNSYLEKFSGLSEADIGSFTDAIISSVKNLSNSLCGNFSLGFKRMVPKNYGLSDGLGVGGFNLLGFIISGRKVALAIIDGNNALPTVRDKVIETLSKDGWDAVELLTTDTHMVNGVSLGGKGYYAIGEKITPEEVSGVFKELSKAVLNDLEKAEVKYVKVRHEFSKIFSEDLLARLAKKSSHLLTAYLILLALSLIVPLTIL